MSLRGLLHATSVRTGRGAADLESRSAETNDSPIWRMTMFAATPASAPTIALPR